jgi:hypothetical protein
MNVRYRFSDCDHRLLLQSPFPCFFMVIKEKIILHLFTNLFHDTFCQCLNGVNAEKLRGACLLTFEKACYLDKRTRSIVLIPSIFYVYSSMSIFLSDFALHFEDWCLFPIDFLAPFPCIPLTRKVSSTSNGWEERCIRRGRANR